MPSVVRILQLSTQSAQVSCFSLFDWKGCHGFGWIIADIINHNYKTLKVPVKRANKLKYSNLGVLSLQSVVSRHRNHYEWHAHVSCVGNSARCDDRLLVCYLNYFNFSTGKNRTCLSFHWMRIKLSQPQDETEVMTVGKHIQCYPTPLKNEQLSGPPLALL